MQKEPSIYISIATIPGREISLSHTLVSLILQTKHPKQVFICVCEKYSRFTETVNVEHIYTPLVRRYIELYNLNVSVIYTKDCGSCTKLLGSLSHIPEDAYILLMDDDSYYKPNIVEDFYKYANAHPNGGACSYDVETVLDLVSGKGVDGFMIYAKHLQEFKSHYARFILDEPVWNFQDDLLISTYLHIKKIPIDSLKNIPNYISYVFTLDTHSGKQMHLEHDYKAIYTRLRSSLNRLL